MGNAEAPEAQVVTPGVDPLLGQVLDGRFRLLARLGEGSMGAVFRAVQVPADREVAVKVLRPGLSDPANSERFRREARTLLHLQHPHIVAAIDFGQSEGGLLYLAMEKLTGKPLRAYEGGAMPWASAVEVGTQVSRALIAAHAAGLVHRDLKPDNIFVTSLPDQPLHVKVLDFGLAKLMDGSSEQQLTRSGFTVGTPAYMSPEQADGRELDPRADLYSLGVVLYELLAGRAPFEGESIAKLIRQVMTEAPPPLPETVPAPLAVLVLRLLSKQPAQRPADATALLAELEAVAAEISGIPRREQLPALERPKTLSDPGMARTQISPRPFSEGRQRSRLAAPLLAAAIAALATVLGLWLLHR